MVLETFFSVSEETRLFLFSCIMGVPVGIVFDVFRVLRVIFPQNKLSVALEDIAFLLVYAVMLMTFAMLFARGEVRFYFVIGNFLGFVLYFFTVGNLLVGIIRKFAEMVKNVFSCIFRGLIKILKFVFCPISQKVRKDFVNNCKKYKQINNNVKIPLIDGYDMVYNENNIKSNRGKVKKYGKAKNSKSKQKSKA